VTIRPDPGLHRPLPEPTVRRTDCKREIRPLRLPERQSHQLV